MLVGIALAAHSIFQLCGPAAKPLDLFAKALAKNHKP